jgi:hypothetical protein
MTNLLSRQLINAVSQEVFRRGRRKHAREPRALPRKFRVATFILSVFHHPHETFFASTGFRLVTRYDGAWRDEF